MNINSLVRVLISSNPDSLRDSNPDVTVEAEYGEVLVEGRLLTLAHHGSRGNNPPPSTRQNDLIADCRTIGVSHIDLDTLGGILSVLGQKPEAPSFWRLAGFVDLHGAHKLGQANATNEDLDRLYAYWAGSENIRVDPLRSGAVGDCTNEVAQLAQLVSKCVLNDPVTLQAGDQFRNSQAALNDSSFRFFVPESGIILRQSESFVNHLYVTPDGEIARAVVTQNPNESPSGGAITASLADPIEGVNIGQLLGEFFTREAGGHAGIGGSERGKARPFSDAEDFAEFLASKMPPQ